MHLDGNIEEFEDTISVTGNGRTDKDKRKTTNDKQRITKQKIKDRATGTGTNLGAPEGWAVHAPLEQEILPHAWIY